MIYDKEKITGILESIKEMEAEYPDYNVYWDGEYKIKAVKEEEMDVKILAPF